jgi:hypothetical protein
MKNWFDIVTPHEDIRKGGFDEAVFAADLGNVVAKRGVEDYKDPYTFYKKTYLTDGLKSLLYQVHDKLASGKGASVLELQTPFGGGKTHALVLIFHYLRNGEKIKDLLPEGVHLVDASVSAIVGTQLNASEGMTSKGVHRRTMWGEMAFQLAGKKGFEQLSANDADRVTPGKGDLLDFLEKQQPFVLLFDEILEYVVKARGVTYADTSLGAQTLAFFNELTEVVASLKHGMMIVTLPSSMLEDFGDTHQQNLAQLEKIFGRLESIVTPVHGEEVYSIIRRRLFESAEDDSQIRAVLDPYIKLYQKHKDELPSKAKEVNYRKKLERSYPFHPNIIDILYEKWGTFASFQRTRGVLRLLANVVEDLYEREVNIDLILPGDINLNRPSIRHEFLKHIGPEYEGIIGSDVAGTEAKSQALDRANKDWKHLAERNATAIFLQSFAADETEKGIGLPYIKLAVLRPETISPLVTEVLQKQSHELWYLNTKGDRYYFSNVPNLNRMILDKKELVANGAPGELRRRIQGELGTRLKCFLWPLTSDEIPDNRDLKLVILDPKRAWKLEELKEWVDRKGEKFRVYKNTMFFAVPDSGRYARFLDQVKEYLALDEILDEIESDERPGMLEKISEVKRRKRDLEDVFPLRSKELYRTAAVPMKDGELERIDLGQPAVGKENLDTWYWNELTEDSRQKIMMRPPSANVLKVKFLSKNEVVNTQVLLEQFYKDTGLQVPEDPMVIAQAISSAVQAGDVGLGRGTVGDIKLESVVIAGFITAHDVGFTEDEFLLSAQKAKELKDQIVEPEPGTTPEPEPIPTPGAATTPTPTTGTGPLELIKHLHLNVSKIRASRIADLHRGMLKPLSDAFGDFEFSMEMDLSSDEGISKKKLEQQVYETLKQLGAEYQVEDAD